MQNIKRGVYFLSNNRMFELTVAFLNSFRLYNKNMPLCLIPFDNNYHKIEQLKAEYEFDIYNNAAVLDCCDQMSVNFHGKVNGAYRKLAAWQGFFDEFIYIDVDTVVLASIEFAFNLLEHHACVTSHSNLPNLVQFVWKKSILEKRILSFEQLAFSANTGFITSKRDFISLEFILSKLDSALYLKDDMVLKCQEQPFLNYLIVSSGKPYTSILKLKWAGQNELMLEMWAGIPDGHIVNGQIRHCDFESIFLVHWAGLWQTSQIADVPYYELWKYYRNIAC